MPYIGTSPSSAATATSLTDADDNTKIQVEESADENIIRFDTAGTEAMKIDANGIVTKPLQPCFQANPTSSQDNIAFNSYVQIAFGTEVYDVNSDFASNQFTAPVDGKYYLSGHVLLMNVSTGYNYYQMVIITSGSTYRRFGLDSASMTGTSGYYMFGGGAVFDMDAGDTADCRVTLDTTGSGSSSIDIGTNSHFSGYLVG